MYAHPVIILPAYFEAIQSVDDEFDRFEINSDFEMVLRVAEPANFYHASLNNES